jgi:hypothetical protein
MAVAAIDTKLAELIEQGLPDTTLAGDDHRVVVLLTQIITLLNDLEARVVVLETP